MKGLGSLALKVVGIGAVVALVVVGAVLSRQQATGEDLPKPAEVIDPVSGFSWDMRGEPKVETTTRTLALEGDASEIQVRIYTVDHGDWIERVQVFNSPPGALDLAEAAVTTFRDGDDAAADGELTDIEFTFVGGFDAATGAVPGTVGDDPADARVFALQGNSYVITGGVAQRTGKDDVDIERESARLAESLGAA